MGSTKRYALPESIKVGLHTVTIRYVDSPDCADPGEFVFGSWCIQDLEIQIRNGLHPTLEWETFWHEVVECINELIDAEMPHHYIQTFGLLLSGITGGMKVCDCQTLVKSIATLPKKRQPQNSE